MYTLAIKALTVSVLLAGHTVLAQRVLESTGFSSIHRRQQFKPETDTAQGADCAAAFGQGSITCRAPTDTEIEECYNPGEGMECCNNQWGCPADSFCLVDGYCCPDGEDPATCAAGFGVSLPADFSTATAAAPAGSAAVTPSSSSAAVSASSGSAAAPSSSSPAVVPSSSSSAAVYSPSSSAVAPVRPSSSASASASTSSLVGVVPTSNATRPTGVYSPTSSGPAVFTGAANANGGFGAAVVVGGLLGLAGNMI